MNVVGRVGNLISQGVYSVATPFHPFGGAVDVIVVEQPDGTYRSTPWYVRFGKFQGVLKGAEKVVTIAVNGAEANFHMFLDNSGQAYFMREVVPGGDGNGGDMGGQESGEPRPSDGGESEEANNISMDDSQNSLNEDIGRTDSDQQQSLRYQDEQPAPESPLGPSRYSSYQYSSLEEVDGSNSEMVLVSVDGHVLTAPISSSEANTEDVQLSNPQFHLGPGESSSGDFSRTADVWEAGLLSDLYISQEKDKYDSRHQSEGTGECKEASFSEVEARNVSISGDEVCDVSVDRDDACDVGHEDVESEEIGAGLNKNDTFKSCLDLISQIDDGDSENGNPFSAELDQRSNSERSPRNCPVIKIKLEEAESRTISYDRNDSSQYLDDELENLGLTSDNVNGQEHGGFAPRLVQNLDLSTEGGSVERNKDIESSTIENNMSECFPVASGSCDKEKLESIPENPAVEEELDQREVPVLQKGFGFEISLCGNLLRPGIGHESAEEVFEAYRVLEEDFKSSGPSIIKNANLIVRADNKYFPWSKVSHVILGKAVFGPNFSVEPKDAIPVEHEETSNAREDTLGMTPSFSRRWRLWPIPFRRSRSLQRSNSDSSTEDLFLDTESVLSVTDEQAVDNNKNQLPIKQFVRTLIPTNEQIASLNLKEGQNMITFSFCTRVLGKQQVDAHIYLWKWNARIVISDVDGTITKSDVLGQVMPLVGRDWSQSGVARLFSAIKENGYQLLFLSARAIVQAYLTRSFLLNLKQDGKALPSGPVVISPDGLFPSLYREVVRRAPHEFKIACLEDIKALFPSDYNPFYAGFGNRDTDELSYKKIGIPKGKIFIINPKGEVAINSCVDIKSYTSLHTLVNDMFPPTSLVEQEDFNSWNYWKMPLPSVDL